ncbi:O-antigen ligase family protein [Clostridium perfringens]|nr:O-antigen ligase family protein [Clostridium perfringens]MDM0449405.1 O-antigen ligase family protein [Clostridium perfringens]
MINIMFLMIFFYPVIDLISNFINNTKLGMLYNVTFLIFLIFFQVISLKFKQFLKVFIVDLIIIIVIYVSYVNEMTISFDTVAFLNFILISSIFVNKNIVNMFKDFILKNYKTFNFIAWTYIFLIFISCLTKSGYEHYWGIITLKGPYLYNHTLAYISLILYLETWFIYKNIKIKAKKYLFFMVVFASFIILTAVRSVAIAFLFVLIFQFKSIKLKKKIKLTIILILFFMILGSFTDILSNNPLVLKNENTIEGGSLSNGRDVFWKEDIRYFKQETDLKEKLLGVGIQKIKEINYSVVGLKIHAHNDIINIIIGYGILGLIIFILLLINISKYRGGLFNFIVLSALLFTNGLFMYFSFVECIPILIISFNEKFYKGV